MGGNSTACSIHLRTPTEKMNKHVGGDHVEAELFITLDSVSRHGKSLLSFEWKDSRQEVRARRKGHHFFSFFVSERADRPSGTL